MSDEAVKAAVLALAQADISGSAPSADTVLRRSALRRRLERAARGSPALEKGLPAVLAGVSLVAIIVLAQVVIADQSEVVASAAVAALVLFAATAVVSSVHAISSR